MAALPAPTTTTSTNWATLDEAGEINDNSFVKSSPQVLMTVRSTDFAVENDCKYFVRID